MAVSGLPFNGPVGAARVGYKDGEYILNPSPAGLSPYSDLDLVVAGTEHAVLMVESEANELSEEVMLGAVLFGHEQMQTAIQAIKELAAEAGKPAMEWVEPAPDESLAGAVGELPASALEVDLHVPAERLDEARMLIKQYEENCKVDGD